MTSQEVRPHDAQTGNCTDDGKIGFVSKTNRTAFIYAFHTCVKTSQEGSFFGPRPKVISIHKRAVQIEQIFLLFPGDSNIKKAGSARGN